VSREYFNQMAATWDEVAAERDSARLARLAQRLDIAPGATVLDAGTGTGVFIPYLLKKIGETGRLIAVDCAEKMLARARSKGFNGNIHFVNADITSVPLPDRTCDAVVCHASFPHFQDKLRVLCEIYRILKARGKLFICHTSGRSEINAIHRGIAVLSSDIIPDNHEMSRMVCQAGFTGISFFETRETYIVSAIK